MDNLLCLSLFPWAPFRSSKAAVKMHTLLDLCGNIPSFIHVPDGKLHDVNLIPEPAAAYVMDCAYLDFREVLRASRGGAFFVARAKSNTDLRRVYSAQNDRTRGIVCDQAVALSGCYSRKRYSRHVRRIRLKGPRSGKKSHLPHQPVRSAADDHMRVVQGALACRVVLQMDQAASAH